MAREPITVPGSSESVASAAEGTVRMWMEARGAPEGAIEDLGGRVHNVVAAGVQRLHERIKELEDR